MVRILDFFRYSPAEANTIFPSYSTADISHPVITDLTVCTSTSTCTLHPHVWHRLEKDLYLHDSSHSAWLYVALANEEELTAEDFVITNIKVGTNLGLEYPWQSRPGGIWILRSKFSGKISQTVTKIDVLFGTDAVDPRPQWTLMHSSLQLNATQQIPAARLSILYGRSKSRSDTQATLRIRQDGKFKIVQISDTHMVTGVGICKDAIDAHGNRLPESEADPLTTQFIKDVLDTEKPDLIIFCGDQLHHDISDSQSALFKVVAPVIERSIPFAVVFGNHDSEGIYALPRTTQMSILQDLPFSLCTPGPELVDGVGNYSLQILAPAPSLLPLSTLYFLDSHGEIRGKFFTSDYEPIKQTQIDWFVSTSRAQRKQREKHEYNNNFYPSLVFFHIPLPEFGKTELIIRSGYRREPTEGPSFNSQFYDSLIREDISAVGCGHDHVNDFCALLPRPIEKGNDKPIQPGPWLCYGGGSGYGGYGSYGNDLCHRRMRVWEIDMRKQRLKTWLQVEYAGRVDELVLVDSGALTDVNIREGNDEGSRVSSR